VPEGAAPEDLERLREAWRAEHQGPRRAGRVAWLLGGMQFAPMAAPGLKDLDFIAGRRFNREEILAVFGVPPAEVQVYEYASYANAEAQSKKFWHNAILPLLAHLEEVLEARLFRPRFPAAVGYFDLANVEDLQDNLDLKSQVAERFWRMGVPFADINARLELGFDAEGKSWLQRPGSAPAKPMKEEKP
jgi:phage portal protein BeeE